MKTGGDNISNRNMKNLENIFKAAASHRRLKIILMLFPDREINVRDIADKLDLSFRSASKHLIKLEKSGYLLSRQAGFCKFYRLDPHPSPDIKNIIDIIIRHRN